MTAQDPPTVAEPPDGTLLYWPETKADWSLVLVRDDDTATANGYPPERRWYRPSDEGSPATWAETVAWIPDIREEATAADPLSGAVVVYFGTPEPVAVGDFNLDDDSLARLAFHAGALSQPLLEGDQSAPYELDADEAASMIAVLAMVPVLVTALRDARAARASKDAEAELLAVDGG